MGPSGVADGVAARVVVGEPDPAFVLAPLLQAPKPAAASAATNRAVVARADVLAHLRDRDTARVNHVVSRTDRTPWGLRACYPTYPRHTF